MFCFNITTVDLIKIDVPSTEKQYFLACNDYCSRSSGRSS